MNFRNVNPHNVAWAVPRWALDPFALAAHMEVTFDAYFKEHPVRGWDKPLPFWVEMLPREDDWSFDIRVPVADDDKDRCGSLLINSAEWQIRLPLNEFLKGAPRSDGTHSVYLHSIQTETPLAYTGVTRRRWFERLSEHETEARRGSRYLFHRALRDHGSARKLHWVMFAGFDTEAAMKYEEELAAYTLDPLGLNMIPGGYAGIRHLGSLGLLGVTRDNRQKIVEGLVNKEFVASRPNLLCAARWEADQDFVNRVVCGHSGRLSVDQVREIKALASIGWNADRIALATGLPQPRAMRVVRGARYGRVR